MSALVAPAQWWLVCVSLLAIGGEDDKEIRTADVHRYDPHTDMWNIVRQMTKSLFGSCSPGRPTHCSWRICRQAHKNRRCRNGSRVTLPFT